MKVTFYGTRGSTPGASENQTRYGGNTTCIRVESDCLPPKTALAIDTGTGFTQMSRSLIGTHPTMAVLYTHYHHDHTQGLFLAPHLYAPHAKLQVYGPSEHGTGPREVFEALFKAPLFPVNLANLQDRISFKPMEFIGTQVIVVHPKAGFHLIPINRYREAMRDGKQIRLADRKESISECLIITMYKTVHPEYTVSYRFTEMTTGHTFVFLTDHENTAGFPTDLLAHVKGAYLLVQDGQYSDEVYQTRTAGFGHGTPEYCAQLAIRGEVKFLGITHHDPSASDEEVDARVLEARAFWRKGIESTALLHIFGCWDYGSMDLSIGADTLMQYQRS